MLPVSFLEPDELLSRGVCAARGISDELDRLEHGAAWIDRELFLYPERFAERLPDLPVEALIELSSRSVTESVSAGRAPASESLETLQEQLAGLEPEEVVRVLNDLSERLLRVPESGRPHAIAVLERLAEIADRLPRPGDSREPGMDPHAPEVDTGQSRALAHALLGESRLLLGSPEGPRLLGEAATLVDGLPAADALRGFLAGALADQNPTRALELAGGIQDEFGRLEQLSRLAGRGSEAFRATLSDEIEVWTEALIGRVDDATSLRVAEALVRLADASGDWSRELALGLLQRAAGLGDTMPPQAKALHWTGLACVLKRLDAAAASEMFRRAAAAADEEDEPVRRLATRVLIAQEGASVDEELAQQVFDEALAAASALESAWELAHVMEMVFRGAEGGGLSRSAALPLLERVLHSNSDEGYMIPGMVGKGDVLRWMASVDPIRTRDEIQKWIDESIAERRFDSLTQAAMLMSHFSAEQAEAALREAAELVLQRVDCCSLAEFCYMAAPVIPDLAIDLAPSIPGHREKSDAIIAGAARLYRSEPARAIAYVESLEQATDRSRALLNVFDAVFQLNDRLQPGASWGG